MRESGDRDVLIDDRIEIECGAVVEVRGGIGKVTQHRSLELRDGGGEALIDGAVHSADKAFQSTLRVRHIRVEVGVPEAEVGVMAWPANRGIADRERIVDTGHVGGEVLGETRIEEDSLADRVSRWGDVGVGRRIRSVAAEPQPAMAKRSAQAASTRRAR